MVYYETFFSFCQCIEYKFYVYIVLLFNMDYFHLIFNECLIHISACFAVGLLVSNCYFLKVLNLYSSIHQPFIEFLSYAQTT